MACVSSVLSPVSFDLCSPGTYFGDVRRFLFTRNTDDDVVASPTLIASWTARIDNSATIPGSGAAPIRLVDVTGSIPAGEKTEITRSLNRKTYTTPKKTVTMRIDDINQDNLDMVADIKANPGVSYKCWFVVDGWLIGGGSGIQCSLSADHITPESRDELQYIEFTATYQAIETTIADPGLAEVEA